MISLTVIQIKKLREILPDLSLADSKVIVESGVSEAVINAVKSREWQVGSRDRRESREVIASTIFSGLLAGDMGKRYGIETIRRTAIQQADALLVDLGKSDASQG